MAFKVEPFPLFQIFLKDLVLVDSTCRNLRRLAIAVASQKAVLLEGPIGCGKTTLVECLAAMTGHAKSPEILKVQLGDQTDSKVKFCYFRYQVCFPSHKVCPMWPMSS